MAHAPAQGIYSVQSYNALKETERAVNKDIFHDPAQGPDTRIFFMYNGDYIYWWDIAEFTRTCGIACVFSGLTHASDFAVVAYPKETQLPTSAQHAVHPLLDVHERETACLASSEALVLDLLNALCSARVWRLFACRAGDSGLPRAALNYAVYAIVGVGAVLLVLLVCLGCGLSPAAIRPPSCILRHCSVSGQSQPSQATFQAKRALI